MAGIGSLNIKDPKKRLQVTVAFFSVFWILSLGKAYYTFSPIFLGEQYSGIITGIDPPVGNTGGIRLMVRVPSLRQSFEFDGNFASEGIRIGKPIPVMYYNKTGSAHLKGRYNFIIDGWFLAPFIHSLWMIWMIRMVLRHNNGS